MLQCFAISYSETISFTSTTPQKFSGSMFRLPICQFLPFMTRGLSCHFREKLFITANFACSKLYQEVDYIPFKVCQI